MRLYKRKYTHHCMDFYLNLLVTKISKISILSAIVTIIFLLLPQSVIATDFYVSPNGNNHNTGLSMEDAWQSPAYGVSKAYAGDTINVAGGTYNDKIVFIRGGIEGSPITLKAYNGTPILDGIDYNTIGLSTSTKDNIIIDGFNVTNYDYGFFTRDSNNILVKNCSFTNMAHDGINLWLGNTNITIENVTISNVTQHAIHIYNQGYAYPSGYITVKNCTLSEAQHNLLDFHTGISNVLIENNELFYENNYADDVGIYLHNGNTDNYIIRNNYIHDMDRPIEIYNSNNVTITGNLIKNIGNKAGGAGIFITSAIGFDDFYGVTNLTVENNTFDTLHHIYSFRGSATQYMNLNIINNTYMNIISINDTFYPHVPLYWSTMQSGYPGILTSTNQYYTVGDIINSSITDWHVKINKSVLPGKGLSFSPSVTSLIVNTAESTTFTVGPKEEITTSKWYLDGTLVKSGTDSYVQEWDTAGTYIVRFDGMIGTETVSRTWTVTVTEVPASKLSIAPSSNVVSPGKPFTIDINIDPVVPVNSARFNVRYDSARTSASDVAPGGLFRGNGVLFDTGVIDNNAGMITGIYGNRYIAPIYGPGTAVIVTMQAGNDTGVLDIALDDIGIVNESAVPLPYTAHAASVLVDTPPEIGPMGPMSVVELEELAFDIPAYDADGDTLIYSSTALPPGASLDSQTGAFTWTPRRGQAGSYTIDFSVSDGHLNDSCSMDIEVLPANYPPVITSFEPQNGTEHMEGRPIEISVQAVDADDDQLTYSIMIDGVSMSDTPSYTWVTDYSSAGEHVIEVAVSDGTHTVTAMRTITVLDVRPHMEIPALPRDGSGTGTSHAF